MAGDGISAWLQCLRLRVEDRFSGRAVKPFVPVRDAAVLLRVHRQKPTFFKPPDFREPTFEVFKPSTTDIDEAKSRSRAEPGVSVFDECRTSQQQAVGIRDHFAGGNLGPTVTLAIRADEVRRIWREYRPVDVLTDPLKEAGGAQSTLPGAHGHCVVEGLYQPDKKLRSGPDYKAMLDRLAAAARVR